MPKVWRVYSGADGKSHIAEMPLAMKPFADIEGAHGAGTPMQSASGIAFRVAPPGYVLNWHCAPRRQYSISLSGTAEIEVGDGTVARVGPGDVILAEDLTGQGHITRVVGSEPRLYALVPLGDTVRVMDRTKSVVTAERFAQGMTFEQYVTYAGTPENLTRESGWWLGPQRRDLSGLLRGWYEHGGLSAAQTAAIRWLAAQPNGPAKILVISEDWSSDCRRDVPMLAHLAGAAGMELRIFCRDGKKLGRGPKADPAESPNADLVNEFLYEKDGQTYQSIPVAVFYTRDLRYLYHYVTMPKVYRKERVVAAMQAPRPGETKEQTWDRFMADWRALQLSPFYPLWASAAVDEMLSALHERLVVGV